LIALDTSALQRYLSGVPNDRTRAAIAAGDAVIAPVVLTEALSNPRLDHRAREIILSLPVLALHDGYWERSASVRADILRSGLKAALADTLIAQSSLDHDVPLITHDDDFRNFVPAGLKLL
jgi:predicted nucleic acid-binding protein